MTEENSTQTKSFNARSTEKKRVNVIVTKSLNAYFRNDSFLISKECHAIQNNDSESRQNNEKIEFFDSTIEEILSIVNVEKHVFYRDVYVVVNRLKNIIVFKDANKLRNIIFQCFRNSVLI